MVVKEDVDAVDVDPVDAEPGEQRAEPKEQQQPIAQADPRAPEIPSPSASRGQEQRYRVPKPSMAFQGRSGFWAKPTFQRALAFSSSCLRGWAEEKIMSLARMLWGKKGMVTKGSSTVSRPRALISMVP